MPCQGHPGGSPWVHSARAALAGWLELEHAGGPGAHCARAVFEGYGLGEAPGCDALGLYSWDDWVGCMLGVEGVVFVPETIL